MTFYPRFEIYKERYDPPFYNNYLHTTTTKLNIDVTIKNEKSIQLIENFPFLYRLINLLIN